MATDAEARAYGFATPAGDEQISEGDNAIRQNARVTTSLIKAAKVKHGRHTAEADAFTMPVGYHTISSLVAAERIANLPEIWPGTLIVEGNDGEQVKAIRFLPYSREYSYETVPQNLTGDFMPWRIIAGAGDSVESGVSPFTQHSVRLTQLMHAYDGPVSTGGLGAVAWRIDHGFRNFRDKMLPIFRAAGIVPMITYNPRNWGLAQNDGVTPAEVNQWVADGWVEISNHGAHHNNASGEEDIYDFVVNGLEEIEAELPAAQGKVFGFCIPGVGGGDAYDGFQSGSTPEQWDTYAGRLILQHHAVGYGYMPGTDLRILDGTPRNGMSHLTTDTRSVSTVTARIDEAIEQRRGLQIMSHPSNLDADGYHSTVMIQQIVDYIVQKRSAGELATLSPYQMMVADSTPPPAVSDVTGLADRLAALEYDSGERNITGLIPAEVLSGALHAWRVGSTVWLDFRDLEVEDPDASYHSWSRLLPEGLTPSRSYIYVSLSPQISAGTSGPVRIDRIGGVVVYNAKPNRRMTGLISFPTPDAPPSTPPGDPA